MVTGGEATQLVVIGGGVAGVCCAQELCRLRPDATVTLISADATVKGVGSVTRITEHLEEISMKLQSLESLTRYNLRAIQAAATSIDCTSQVVHISDGTTIAYDQLCICTGAAPRVALQHEHVIALRDHDSIQAMRQRLGTAKRVMVVGNGGIALELVHALRDVETVWAVRNQHIGDAFFDVDAARFLLQHLQSTAQKVVSGPDTSAATTAVLDSKERKLDPSGPNSTSTTEAAPPSPSESGSTLGGRAVGPQWVRALPQVRGGTAAPLTLEYGCELQKLVPRPSHCSAERQWPLYVELTSGAVHGVDFVVSATGVSPSTHWLPPDLNIDPTDGGVMVDECMRTSRRGVYAAGDICRAASLEAASSHWFQMRLWTQARTMGIYAAQCMFNDAVPEEALLTGMHFELFTHATRFCGKKVVLLGLYNGQRLDEEPDEDLISYARSTEGADGTFVRVLLLRGRLQGAVLIGDTELEEVFENLILDGLDLSRYGPDLVDPEAELDHIFD